MDNDMVTAGDLIWGLGSKVKVEHEIKHKYGYV